MSSLLTADELEAIRRFNSPTIANAIETFDVRPREEGVTGPGLHCILPPRGGGAVIGYARTAVIESMTPPAMPRTVNRKDYWRYTQAGREPKITVVRDRSPRPGGAYWGEVNASIHQALGSVAVLTNGTVRDLDEVERVGFGLFASGVEVSHGHAHLEEFDVAVELFGMTVRTGDLIHADRHGAIVIPHEIAREVAAAARRVELAERPMLDACRLADPVPELDRLIPPQY